MPSGILPLDMVAGPESTDLGLVAAAALEGPQVLLTWNRLYVSCAKFRIVQRLDHPPTGPDDGLTVYESAGFTDTVGAGVTLVSPARYYYYRAFCLLGASWYEPDNATASVMSGAYPKLEPTGDEGYLAYDEGANNEFGILQQGSTWTYVTGLDLAAGDWIRVGEVQPVDIHVNRVDGNAAYFDVVEEPIERELELPELKGFTVTIDQENTAYSNEPTIRVHGIDLAATGYAANQFIKVSNTRYHNGLHVVSALSGDIVRPLGFGPLPGSFNVTDAGLGTFGVDEPESTAPVISLAPGKGPGTKVFKLRQVNSWLADQTYREYLPPEVADDDVETAQGEVLTTTQLDDGSYAALGTPGLQFGLQRWLRVLAAEYAKAHAESNMLGGLLDLSKAPLPFLNQFSRYFDYVYDPVAEGANQRTQVLIQPRLLQLRGRNNTFALYLRRQTGAIPAFVYGRDRICRLDNYRAADVSTREFYPVGAVDGALDQIQIFAHGWATGTRIRYLNTGQIGMGLTSGSYYFVRVLSDDFVSMHPTAADADADTNKVNLTAVGGDLNLLVNGDPREHFLSGFATDFFGEVGNSSWSPGVGTIVTLEPPVDWSVVSPEWMVGLHTQGAGVPALIVDVTADAIVLDPDEGDRTADYLTGNTIEVTDPPDGLEDFRYSICSYDTDCAFNDKGLMVYLKVTPTGVQLSEVVEVAKDFHPAAETWLIYDAAEALVLSLY